MSSDSALSGCLEALVDRWTAAGVVVRAGWRPVATSDLSALWPLERMAVERAVPARRHEFASGRALLRELLDHRGPIPVGRDRAPVVPPGARASLSHDADDVVAIASTDVAVHSMGVDLVTWTELDAAERSVVVRSDDADLAPIVVFAAKEAVYKAWSGLGGGLLDHHDVRLTAVDDEALIADVVGGGTESDDHRSFEVRRCRVGDRVLTVSIVPASGFRGGGPEPTGTGC